MINILKRITFSSAKLVILAKAIEVEPPLVATQNSFLLGCFQEFLPRAKKRR